MAMPIGAKIAIGVGAAAALAVTLAACAPKEEDPQSRVLDEFQPFDKNKDNQWTKGEATRFEVGRPYTTNHSERRVGDFVHWSRQIVHKETTHSMQKAFAAASGNDAIASLQELTDLARKFDVDKNGTLNRKEQRAFNDAYAATAHSRTILDRTESGVRFDPYPEPRPDFPAPGNGPGDSGGWPGSGGSNGPGDSGGGYVPPSSGNGGGDSGGSYRPPSNGGGSGNGSGDSGGSYTPPSTPSRPSNPSPPSNPAPNNPGDSSDNGNPGYDDF